MPRTPVSTSTLSTPGQPRARPEHAAKHATLPGHKGKANIALPQGSPDLPQRGGYTPATLTDADVRRLGMALDDKTVKIVLDERDLPTHWYNIVPDLPSPPAPPLHPGTGQPLGPADLAPLFPMGIIMQEVSQEPRIEIPDQVRDIYRLRRPTPMYRARRLEKALDTPAHIYY